MRRDILELALWTWSMGVAVHCMQLTPVPDGVVVEPRGEVRVIKAMIHTYVEIDTQPASKIKEQHIKMANKIWAEAIRLRDQGLHTHESVMEQIFGWRVRRITTSLGVRERKKRGLFDFVGKIGKGLFGLATSDDVDRIRLGVNAVMRNQQSIVKTQKGLVKVLTNVKTVVNERSETLKSLVSFSKEVWGQQRVFESQIAKVMDLVELEAVLSGLENPVKTSLDSKAAPNKIYTDKDPEKIFSPPPKRKAKAPRPLSINPHMGLNSVRFDRAGDQVMIENLTATAPC